MPTTGEKLAKAFARVTGDPATPPDVRAAAVAVWRDHRGTITEIGVESFHAILVNLTHGRGAEISRELVDALSAEEIVATLKKQTARLQALRKKREARLDLLGDLATAAGKLAVQALLAALA